MADIRINALATTAASTASDDFIAVDGSANGTRKLNAYSPTFGGNLTVSGSGTSSAGSINVANPSTTGDANYATLLAASQPTSTTNWFNIGVAPAPYNWAALGFYYAGSGSASNALVFARYGAELGRWTFDKTLTVGGNLTVSGTGTSDFAGLISAGGINGRLRFYASNAPSSGATRNEWRVNLRGANEGDWGLDHTTDGSTWSNFLVLNASGNLLVGTTTDSANGKLQLATHTTSAGGIGFGPDVSLFRSGSGTIRLSSTATAAAFRLINSVGTTGLAIEFDNNTGYVWNYQNSSLLFGTNNTLALTLDSSQNAEFKGEIYGKKDVYLYGGNASIAGRISANSAAGGLYFLNQGTSTGMRFYVTDGSANPVLAQTLDATTGNATFAGKVTANGAGSTFKGTTTNDSAAAGYVGELISATDNTGVSLTTGTRADVVSISLTAGDWDVTGYVGYLPSGGASSTYQEGSISATSATIGSAGARTLLKMTTTAQVEFPIPTVRVSLSATTTYYLVTNNDFSGGTMKGTGIIRARRVR